MPRLDSIEKQMSINVFYTISALISTILYSYKQSAVHTRWRHQYLTINMFKFTDVTAFHV